MNLTDRAIHSHLVPSPARGTGLEIGRPRMMILGVLLVPLVACGGSGQGPAADAATDFVSVDTPVMADSAAVPLALDFSVTGCDSFDTTIPRCTGTAPLTLTFTPVASADLTHFLWTFGDDTNDSYDRSPTHSYSLPGLYPVNLAGQAGSGSLQKNHPGFVNVLAAPPGAWCDIDAQCAPLPGLRCLCGSMTPCSPVLARGLCTLACDAAAGGPALCPDATVCADLSVGATPADPPMTPSTSNAWRRALCLPTCTDDTTCAPGLRCRDFPSGAADGTWTRACFGGSYPLAIGARCGNAAGRPVHADCASHLCADLGAFDRCSADCSAAPCPAGTGCAHFGDGRNLCVATCSPATDAGVTSADAGRDAATTEPPADCSDDPLLACQLPGGTGSLSFTLADGPAGARYCSPRRCVTSADCGPGSTCPDGSGACARESTAP